MNVFFKLANKNKKGEKLIVLAMYYNKDRFVFSTGETILPEHWHPETMRPSADKELPRQIAAANKIKKNILDRYENTLLEIIGEYKRAGIDYDNQILKNEMLQRLKPGKAEKKPIVKQKDGHLTDFYQIIDAFIQDSKSGIRNTRKGTNIKFRRIQKYEALKTMLQEWRPVIHINDIDMDFYQELVAHRNDKKKAINTIGMDIKVLKSILKYTYGKLHHNDIFKNDDFRAFEEIGEHIYLNDADLDKLWNLKNLKPNLERTRDVFLIGCYTSLRISDLGVLEEFNIIKSRGGSLLKIIQQKGDEPVFIPIHSRVRQLLDKYGGTFPKAYSDQKMNLYLPKLCEEAKLNDVQQYKITRGGKVERFVKKKWELVKNHTARRSFATNMIIAGFNPLAVMKITGHKNMKDFMRYVCITQQEMAHTMAKHKYFK